MVIWAAYIVLRKGNHVVDNVRFVIGVKDVYEHIFYYLILIVKLFLSSV